MTEPEPVSDLVERLVEYGKDWRTRAADASICAEAAAALTKLQQERDIVDAARVNALTALLSLQQRVDWFENELAKADEWKAHNKALQQRVEELETQLEED